MTEKELREKVVNTAIAWLGCKESDGTFKPIIDLYNSHAPLARGYKMRYSDEWCAAFVSAVAIKCGLTDIIPTECSCNKMIDLHNGMGTWVENDAYTPAPGDIIMYDWDDDGKCENTNIADHVGIVVSVTNGFIKVIEGNRNEVVAYRTIAVNGKYIRGYCVPDYAKKADAAEEAPPEKQEETKHEAAKDESVIVEYAVKTEKHGWLPMVQGTSDFAGHENSPIVAVAMRVNKGSIKYRVHVAGGGWLGWIYKCDLADYYNGYAGNGLPIDAIQIYYYTPDDIRPYKKAAYRVMGVGRENYWDWQFDTETTNGQDGYAGTLYGIPLVRLQCEIK